MYEAAAKQGHPDAANNLADMYFNGEGVPENLVLAKKWFDFAAQQGVSESMFTLGIIYEQGLGIDKNEEQACSYYRRSAEAGYVEAQYRLGGIYLEGRLGQPKDVNRGLFWYEKLQSNITSIPFMIWALFGAKG